MVALESDYDRRSRHEQVLDEVFDEMERQHARWGQQDHPLGTGPAGVYETACLARDAVRAECDRAHKAGTGTWLHILLEEMWEAFAETDPAKVRSELIQVAAVTVSMIRSIDRASVKEGADHG